MLGKKNTALASLLNLGESGVGSSVLHHRTQTVFLQDLLHFSPLKPQGGKEQKRKRGRGKREGDVRRRNGR